MKSVVAVRVMVAIAGLLTLGGLVVMAGPGDSYGRPPLTATRLLLLAVFAAIVALVQGKPWGRWLGLAGAIAVLPWAVVLTVTPGIGSLQRHGLVALVASGGLLLALSGRTMFDRFEGRVTDVDWRGGRMRLVRWAVITNLASAIGLYIFVSSYSPEFGGSIWGLAGLLVVLIVGVLLLARQKTAGLLLVALGCIAFVPLGAAFVAAESRSAGEAWLFVVLFLPGIALGWATLAAFARGIVGHLKG